VERALTYCWLHLRQALVRNQNLKDFGGSLNDANFPININYQSVPKLLRLG